MQKRADTVTDLKGNVIPGASVRVTTVAGVLATIFSNEGITQISNPLTTGATGRYEYYAADGDYTEQVYVGDTLFATNSDVTLKDPATSPTFAQLAAPGGSELSGHITTGLGSVASTTGEVISRTRSFFDFFSQALKGAVRSGTYTAALEDAMWDAENYAFNAALAEGFNLFLPGDSLMRIRDHSHPWRQSVLGPSLLDCLGITIFGQGPTSVFSTISSGGADVFQLAGLKNLHFDNLSITAALTATGGNGSNGVSFTGGLDNITMNRILIDNCQGIDKGASIDGGKGFSHQCDAATLEVGTLRITNSIVRRCAQGFGFESGLFNFLSKKVAVDVRGLLVEDCYVGATMGGVAASGAIPAGTQSGVRVQMQTLNCQKDVVLARIHGVHVTADIVTTKSEAARRLDPRGVAWFAADTAVEALQCTYAKDSTIIITGNKGACAQKARIGGASPGSSGLTGATENCDISLKIAGTASVANLVAVNSGGNVMSNSRLDYSVATHNGLPPAEFLTAATANICTSGSTLKGSFTGTLTGCTTSPTGTITWTIVGNTVTLNIPAIVGVSNTTGCQITGMPAEIFPATAQYPQALVTDNGIVGPGRVLITAAGAMILNKLNASGFTAAANKGIPEVTLTYQRF